MSFTSWVYPFLLIASCVAYWSLRSQKSRVGVIVLASCIFYGSWDARFLALLMGTAIMDFFITNKLANSGAKFRELFVVSFIPLVWLGVCFEWADWVPWVQKPTINDACLAALLLPLVFQLFFFGADRIANVELRRKYLVALSVCGNLLILAFFKYFGFFRESAERMLSWAGISPGWPMLEIILPVGISFYTFQSLSCVVDVYRGQTRPPSTLAVYGAYLSFFPQLVAGPIERSVRLLPQMEEARRWDVAHLHDGCRMLLAGFFLKMFVADQCAVVANYVFDPETQRTALWSLAGAVAFTFQIYGDFAGYSLIALGSARLFGVELMGNFRFPYFSRGPSDFWSRWHISLSSWFRDYVYIPLGGNRGTRAMVLRNLLITMVLAGLWHGASWMFVAWGIYHGLLLVLYRAFPVLGNLETSKGRTVLFGSVLIWFGFTVFGWVLFRSVHVGIFSDWCLSLTRWDFSNTEIVLKVWAWLLIPISLLLLLQAITWKARDESALTHLHPVLRGLLYALLFALTVASGGGDQEFIYFQF